MIALFKSLSDETRIKIVGVLSHGEFTVQELTKILDMGQSRISRHLKILTDAGITQYRREGSWAYYRLAPENGFRKKIVNVIKNELDASGESFLDPIHEILEHRKSISRNFFLKHGRNWDVLRAQFLSNNMLKSIFRKHLDPSHTIADLGCGSGESIIVLRKSGFDGRIIGVDNSPIMLKNAQEKVATARLASVEFRLGDLEHLPMKDNESDALLAVMVLHHMAQPEFVFREFFRALAPGGKLLVIDLLKHENEKFRLEMGDLWLGFSPEDLSAWTRDSGFADPVIIEKAGKERIVVFATRKPNKLEGD
jgi:ubiquinone/menaquinone biosynthesis C-methylase UbiE/DNA-binding transcriptional ArsR family regulator